MGASTKTLSRLLHLKNLGYIGAASKMMELGAQNIRCLNGASDLASFLENFNGSPPALNETVLARMASGGTMAEVMRLCGLDYLAYDIFNSDSTILFDLNTDKTPADLVGKFDLVTNLGTTEHLIGQHNAMEVMHDLTKVGGILYHDLPMGGYFYHGYFSYNPLFFHHLAAANGYEVVFRHFSKVPETTPYGNASTSELLAGGWPEPGYHDVGIEFIFRKTMDAPFQVPIEVGTSNDVDREFLLAKRPGIRILDGANEQR